MRKAAEQTDEADGRPQLIAGASPPKASSLTAMQITLPPARGYVPRKRFRGRRRHFQSVRARARDFRLDVTRDGVWWNLWHYHADWWGWGNSRLSYRREYFMALATVFVTIEDALRTSSIPFQLWILLSARDAAEDAVFLHTKNPYAAEFPLNPGLEMGVPDPLLSGLCAEAGLGELAAARASSGDVWLHRPGSGLGFRLS